MGGSRSRDRFCLPEVRANPLPQYHTSFFSVSRDIVAQNLLSKMVSGIVWRALVLLFAVAKIGNLAIFGGVFEESVFCLGFATPHHDGVTALSAKPTRSLKGIACSGASCGYANSASVSKFISYLAGTADDVCNCTCNSDDASLLHLAAASSNKLSNIIIQRLMSEKCTPEVVDQGGNTPLHDACKVCNIRQATVISAIWKNAFPLLRFYSTWCSV